MSLVQSTITDLVSSKSESYKILTSDNMIKIEGVKGNVSLFDISGRKIQSVNITGTFNSKTLSAGLYIVSIDCVSTKVSVK